MTLPEILCTGKRRCREQQEDSLASSHGMESKLCQSDVRRSGMTVLTLQHVDLGQLESQVKSLQAL